MKAANPPRKHHFLPQGFQRAWVGSDGKVERFALDATGNVRARRLAPAAVGWAADLYQIPGEPDPWKASEVETEFFSRIDAAAARIMQEMRRTCRPPTNAEDRSAWVSFLLTLLHRTPGHMRATIEKLTELNTEIMPEAEARYHELKVPDDPDTFAEWEAARAPHAIDRSALRTIMDLVVNPSIGSYLINLEWAVLDLTGADYDLLLGDNPVILVPLKNPQGHIACPIGPLHLFVASEHPPLLSSIRAARDRDTVRAVNRLQVERADSLVLARDRRQEKFIGKHFRTCQIGSIATGWHQPPRPR